MRILFTGPAAAGHLFPMVPTAQALRAAGHQVLFAASRPLEQLLGSGFPVTEIGDGSTIQDAMERSAARGAGYVNRDRTQDEILELAAVGFAELSRPTVSGLLAVAERWRPDVLVYDSFQAAAPLVAAKLGIPSVLHNFGVVSGHGMVARLAANFQDVYKEYEVSGPAVPIALDVLPASLGGDGNGWRVRYVPYNGGGLLPVDLLERADRPRVVVTLGTVLTQVAGVRAITELAAAAGSVDAEFLLAVGGADLSQLGALPGNIRPLPWVPLAELLATADAVVHHGGSGTMLTALTAGIPQLLLPQGADHFANAGALVAAGAALSARSEDVDDALLTRLLIEPALRTGAAALLAQNAALPVPATLVPEFEALAARSA